MEITPEELTKLWNTWIGDSSLRSTLRFGQFVCDRKIQAGYCWPECYYASTEKAWTMLFELATGLTAFSGRKAY
jgi:hypothetical protein